MSDMLFTQEWLVDLVKNSSDAGLSPASWMDVKPYDKASLTVALKRLNKSRSVGTGLFTRS
jgi:hypothetical protein